MDVSGGCADKDSDVSASLGDTSYCKVSCIVHAHCREWMLIYDSGRGQRGDGGSGDGSTPQEFAEDTPAEYGGHNRS